VYVYGAHLATGVLGVLFVPFATRLLGFEGYALWSIYGVMQGYVVLVEFGLGKNLVRLLAAADASERRADLLRNAVACYLLVAGILCVLAFPLAWFATLWLFPVPPGQEGQALAIAVLAAIDYVLGIPTALRGSYTVGQQEFSRLARSTAASGVLRFGFPLLALAAGATPLGVVAVTVARRLPEWWLASRLLSPVPHGAMRPTFDGRRIGAFFRQTAALAYAQILQVGIMSFGIWAIGRRADLAAVGAFRGLFDLASKVWFISSGISLVIYPAFAGMLVQPEQRSRLGMLLPLALRASLQVYAVTLALGVLVGVPLLPLLGFPDPAAQQPFALLLAGSVAMAHASVSYELLQSDGAFVRAAVVNALILGAYGAAVAALPDLPALVAVTAAWAVAQTIGVIALDRGALTRLGAVPRIDLPRAAVAATAALAVFAAAPARADWKWALLPLAGVAGAGAIRDGRRVLAQVGPRVRPAEDLQAAPVPSAGERDGTR
jgi:O-antigen/teichoic acid export membrane protein